MQLKRINSAIDRVERNKINENFGILESAYGKSAIDAQTAREQSDYAIETSEDAKRKAESTQIQLNTVVIEGDSSIEAAQARVSVDDTVYTTLKERLDAENTQVTQQLAQIELFRQFNIPNDAVYDFSTKTLTGTDATPSLNAYFSYCATLRREAYVPPGHYKVDGSLTWLENLDILGAQKASNITDNGLTEWSKNATNFYFTNPEGSGIARDIGGEMFRNQRGRISNIAFINVSSNPNKILVDLYRVQNSEVSNNVICGYSNGKGIGIRIQSDGSFNTIHDNRIIYLQDGIKFDGETTDKTADGNTITNNTIFENEIGINFVGFGNANLIIGNNIALNAEHDIYLGSAQNNWVINNRIESDAANAPIYISGNAFNNVLDNFITHVSGTKILVYEENGTYGSNSVRHNVTGFYNQKRSTLIGSEQKITLDAPKNIFHNSRFPHLSEWLYRQSTFTYSHLTSAEGFTVLSVTNNSGSDGNVIFLIPTTLQSYIKDKKLTVGAWLNSEDQTDCRIGIFDGSMESSVSLKLNSVGYDLFNITRQNNNVSPTQIRFSIGAGKTLKIRMPYAYVGATAHAYPLDFDYYSEQRERRGNQFARPPLTANDVGICYYDTFLKKPIWWTGTSWVDATGTAI